MCDWSLPDEVIARDDTGRPTVFCDPCIAPIVRALNEGGIPTAASCCGHGNRTGRISLVSGRDLFLVAFDTAQAVDARSLVDIHGEPRRHHEM